MVAEHIHNLQQGLDTKLSGEIIELERKQIMPGLETISTDLSGKFIIHSQHIGQPYSYL